MEGEQRQRAYEDLNRDSINKDDHIYELCQVTATEEGRAKKRRVNQPEKRKNMELAWNQPVIIIIIIVLLSLIVILLVVICLMLSQISARDTTSTTGATATAGTTTGAITEDTTTEVNTTTKVNTTCTTGVNSTAGASTSSSGSSPGAVDDILLIAQELYNASTALPTSCEQLKVQHQITGSGYYILASANGSTTYSTYCNMGLLCGSGGGWTRIAYLHLYGQNCPSGFRPYRSGGYYRACGRPVTNSGSCVSVQFPSNGISYSQICGRVQGYQYGSTDAVDNLSSSYRNDLNSSYRNDLNSYYVDGVSITRGSPRQHVWTLMAGYSEARSTSDACPCNNGSSVSVQSFIGNNYFCESGNPDNSASNTLYTSDRLWDGNGYSCRSLEVTCCNFSLPWFHRDYGSTTTTDYIELRVCGDEGTDNEDSPITSYEIYVK